MPPLKLSCNITATRTVHHSGGFTEYRVEVTADTLQWEIWRRFSEFLELDEHLRQMLGEAKAQSLPPPPEKNWWSRKDPAFVDLRRKELRQYLRALFEIPDVCKEVQFLQFMGLLSIDKPIEKPRKSSVNEEVKKTLPMNASMLHKMAETGDILLFRTKNTAGAMQRIVTNSSWDHVGMVVHYDLCGRVCGAQQSESVNFLEADSTGVKTYCLDEYMKYKWHDLYDEVALRTLQWPGRGHAAEIEILSKFVTEVVGKPYGLSISKLTRSTNDGVQEDNYFCSEVVAIAWQRLGLISEERPASGYWPVTFSQGSELELLKGCQLSDETPIDFRVPEVANARRLGNPRNTFNGISSVPMSARPASASVPSMPLPHHRPVTTETMVANDTDETHEECAWPEEDGEDEPEDPVLVRSRLTPRAS